MKTDKPFHGWCVWWMMGIPVWGVIDRVHVYRLEGDIYAAWEIGADWKVGRPGLLPPAAPTKIVCVGRNYVAHAAEHGVEVPYRATAVPQTAKQSHWTR